MYIMCIIYTVVYLFIPRVSFNNAGGARLSALGMQRPPSLFIPAHCQAQWVKVFDYFRELKIIFVTMGGDPIPC